MWRLIVLTLLLMAGGCQTAQEEFAADRLEKICDGAVPICQSTAACVLGRRDYLSGEFPGGQRFIVQTDQLDKTIAVRVLFERMVYPGTEFMLQLFGPGCTSLETEQILDVDLFERAGDDQVLTFVFPIDEPGDHMLELFSDMAATYLLAIELER